MTGRARELLNEIPGFRDRDARVSPLSGGITNQNFRVDVDGESYVLRITSASTDHLGIRRDHERACMRIAAELGIGAEVICSIPERHVLVSRFVHGRALTSDDARTPETLERIVESIKCYHEGPDFPGSFSAFETVRDYHRLALENGVSFPDELPEALDRMARIETALASRRTSSPCHNDLLAGNLIDDGETIRIIDWEYAAMGDPFFDLGNFAVNQALRDDESDLLLKLYFGELRRSDRAHLELMKMASDLREAFWGFAQSALSDLDFDYGGYGARHVERFMSRSDGLVLDACRKQLSEG